MKIPFISQTYTTAVAISFRQSHARTSNIVKYHTRVVFTESFHAMVCTDEDVCSTCVIDESKLRHVRLDNSTLMPNMGITFKAFQTFKTLFCFNCPVSNEQKCFTYFSVLRLRWKVQKAELQFSRILSGAQCKIASSARGKFIPECRSKTLNKQGSPFRSKVGIQSGPV